MNNQTRRELLADIGRGMVVAGIGSLARVTASAYGQKAPGCSQAKEVLKV